MLSNSSGRARPPSGPALGALADAGRDLARVLAWHVNKRVLRRPAFDVRLFGTMRVRCYVDSSYSRYLLTEQRRAERDVLGFVRAYLREGDAFLDVGANVGVYTLLAASRVGPRGRLVAVEPVPATARKLRENLRLNGLDPVEVHEAAVGEEEGTVRFRLVESYDPVNHVLSDAEPDDGATVHVPLVRLDRLLGGRRFDLAKVDVEGFELPAFRGCGALLGPAHLPCLVFEVNESLRRYGYAPADVLGHLHDRGYLTGRFDAEARALVRDGEIREDVVAIHREAVGEVRARLPGVRLVGF